MSNTLEEILDAHAKHYIQATIAYIKAGKGEPTFTELNEADTKALHLITLHTKTAELKARIRENKFWSNGLFDQELSRPPFITITDFHTRIADIEAQLTNPTEPIDGNK